jgi:hypothetical protein
VAAATVDARLRAASAHVGFLPVAEAFSPAVLAEYEHGGGASAAGVTSLVDAATGAVTRRLQNGLLLTHLRTHHEPSSCRIELLARGGLGVVGLGSLVWAGGERYAPLAEPFPDGAIMLAVAHLVEAGCGGLSARAISQACALMGLSDFKIDADCESVSLSLTLAHDGADESSAAAAAASSGSCAGGGSRGLDCALQLLHATLFSSNVGDEVAFARAKDTVLSELDEAQRTFLRLFLRRGAAGADHPWRGWPRRGAEIIGLDAHPVIVHRSGRGRRAAGPATTAASAPA